MPPTLTTSGTRQRGMKTGASSPLHPTIPQNDFLSKKIEAEDSARVFSTLDILRVLLIIISLALGTSYYLTSGTSLLYGYKPWFTNPTQLAHWWHGPIDLTLEQLSQFNGTDPEKPIYLAINGTIFDVSEGRSSYGPGGGYSVFAGRDATRAFVTGCFLEDRTSDMRGAEEVYLPIEDIENEDITSGERKTRAERERREAKKRVIAEVQNWETFYTNNAKYFEVGKVLGVKHDPKAPLIPLCEHAMKGRPKRSKMNVDNDRSPGKPV